MSGASETAAPVKSQYHHFVPRLILRNYADTSAPAAPRSPRGRRNGKKAGPQLQGARDSMINLVNLETMGLEQAPLSRAFGIQDMYRDFDRSNPDQHRIEQKLANLESRAGKILAKARQAFDAGKGQAEMLRGERDTLRKFLFIMMYRNKKFHGRFNLSSEQYFANDRATMMSYMRDKGFKKPVDVWFDNLEAFIDLEMDPELKWMQTITKRAYLDDAMWFVKNAQMYYLCFCTPKDPETEFLLTENSYGVFEGCTNNRAWTDFHLFAPVSPRLMIVLRSGLLPSGYDEGDEDVRLQQLRDVQRAQNPLDPESVRSWLEDLPVKKALNNYSKIVDGAFVPLPTRIRPENHKFYFRFFPIESEHVQKMNIIFIENAFGTKAILFKSKPALRRALEAFLLTSCPGFKVVTMPPHGSDGPFFITSDRFEIVETWPDADRVSFFKGLENVARELGSGAKARYTVIPTMPGTMGVALFKKQDFMRRYEGLGGSKSSFIKDFEQVHLMMTMGNKVESTIRNSPLDLKSEVRKARRQFICQLPVRRVWLYVKYSRSFFGEDLRAFFNTVANGVPVDGPEDAVVEAAKLFCTEESLCRVLHHAALMDDFRARNPHMGIAGNLQWDDGSAKRIQEEREIVFGQAPGSIRNCGIPQVQELVKSRTPTAGHNEVLDELAQMVLSEEQRTELRLRKLAQAGFQGALKGLLPRGELRALEMVLFEVVYPADFWNRRRRTAGWWKSDHL